MKLTGRLARIDELTGTERGQMFALMDAHYHNVARPRFDADLEEKQWAILVESPAGEVLGFSTQVLLDVAAAGRPLRALFSGDTIVDRRFWGDRALASTWGRFALSLIDAHPGGELYWFLISKGYKTYRFLPLFFAEYYPRLAAPTPGWAQLAIDALARDRYADDYDAARGVIVASPGKDFLRHDIAPITAERLTDAHVRFFVDSNPGHARGDELCCLAPLTRENFTPAAYRVIGPTGVAAPAALARRPMALSGG
ncbi:MAG: hypothetical protein AB7K24_21190 [Gemmataceae bacterium]